MTISDTLLGTGRVIGTVEDMEVDGGAEDFVFGHVNLKTQGPSWPHCRANSSMLWLEVVDKVLEDRAIDIVLGGVAMRITTAKPALAWGFLKATWGTPTATKGFKLR